MNERPPSIVFNRLFSTLKARPTIADTVGNNSAEHKILAPDIGVEVSFRNRNDDESSICLRNINCKREICE